MIDKDLFQLLGKNKKYIFIVVAFQLLGLVANIGITASICYAIYLVTIKAQWYLFLYPLAFIVIGIIVRFCTTKFIGDVKDTIGRKVKKDLREIGRAHV